MATKRPRHKDIERAVRRAELKGWTVQMSSGHRWATLLCTRRDREGCRVPVYSTPRNPEQHARRLVRLMLCSSGGRAFVAVDREADTLDTAIRSAITEVEAVLPDIRVVRVEVDRADLDAPTAA